MLEGEAGSLALSILILDIYLIIEQPAFPLHLSNPFPAPAK